jgi:hypothetical protein
VAVEAEAEPAAFPAALPSRLAGAEGIRLGGRAGCLGVGKGEAVTLFEAAVGRGVLASVLRLFGFVPQPLFLEGTEGGCCGSSLDLHAWVVPSIDPICVLRVLLSSKATVLLMRRCRVSRAGSE